MIIGLKRFTEIAATVTQAGGQPLSGLRTGPILGSLAENLGLEKGNRNSNENIKNAINNQFTAEELADYVWQRAGAVKPFGKGTYSQLSDSEQQLLTQIKAKIAEQSRERSDSVDSGIESGEDEVVTYAAISHVMQSGLDGKKVELQKSPAQPSKSPAGYEPTYADLDLNTPQLTSEQAAARRAQRAKDNAIPKMSGSDFIRPSQFTIENDLDDKGVNVDKVVSNPEYKPQVLPRSQSDKEYIPEKLEATRKFAAYDGPVKLGKKDRKKGKVTNLTEERKEELTTERLQKPPKPSLGQRFSIAVRRLFGQSKEDARGAVLGEGYLDKYDVGQATIDHLKQKAAQQQLSDVGVQGANLNSPEEKKGQRVNTNKALTPEQQKAVDQLANPQQAELNEVGTIPTEDGEISPYGTSHSGQIRRNSLGYDPADKGYQLRHSQRAPDGWRAKNPKTETNGPSSFEGDDSIYAKVTPPSSPKPARPATVFENLDADGKVNEEKTPVPQVPQKTTETHPSINHDPDVTTTAVQPEENAYENWQSMSRSGSLDSVASSVDSVASSVDSMASVSTDAGYGGSRESLYENAQEKPEKPAVASRSVLAPKISSQSNQFGDRALATGSILKVAGVRFDENNKRGTFDQNAPKPVVAPRPNLQKTTGQTNDPYDVLDKLSTFDARPSGNWPPQGETGKSIGPPTPPPRPSQGQEAGAKFGVNLKSTSGGRGNS